MRYSKLFAGFALIAGLVATGAQAKAADRWDVHNDNRRVEAIRADIARDRARLAEAQRHGHYGDVAAIRRDLARDEANLRAQQRDIRHDVHDRY